MSLSRRGRRKIPDVMQQTMQKWMALFKALTEKGHVKDVGQPLERSGKLVKGKQKASAV